VTLTKNIFPPKNRIGSLLIARYATNNQQKLLVIVWGWTGGRIKKSQIKAKDKINSKTNAVAKEKENKIKTKVHPTTRTKATRALCA